MQPDLAPLMKAIFAQTRCQILLASESELFTDAYLYAWEAGVFPIFDSHDSSMPPLPHQPLDEQFLITSEAVIEIVDYIDNIDATQSQLDFYDMEAHFGGRTERSKLIHVCRYCWLDDRYKQLIQGMLAGTHHPTEAMSIIRPFTRTQISL